MLEDQGLLRALFRFGGDPGHPLSWFGPASRAQRQASMEVFAAAIEGERLPDDVQAAAPTLLWTLHMGVLLYFLYDSSDGFRKTRRLVDAAVDFVIDAKRIATLPLMRPVRRRVFNILRDAGLLAARRCAVRCWSHMAHAWVILPTGIAGMLLGDHDDATKPRRAERRAP